MKLGIVFNNTDLATVLPDTVLYIGNVTGREFVSPDVTTVAYKGAHGSRFVGNRYPARDIQVEVTVIGYCFQMMPSYASKLMSVLATDVPASLSFSDQEGTYQAIVSAIDLEEHETYATGTITFTCPDPFRYGAVYDIDFDTLPTDTLHTNYNVEPVFNLVANKSANNFSMNVNGDVLTLDMQVAQGDVIVVNSETRTVTVNNKLTVLETSGTFPKLRQSGNTVRFYSDCGGNGSYTARWL